MSDPVTNVEIEDVLSSIRRLVTEENRPEKRRVAAEQPRSADRLVLTPALRVADEPEPEGPDAFVFESRMSRAKKADARPEGDEHEHAEHKHGDSGQTDVPKEISEGETDDGLPWSDPATTLFQAAQKHLNEMRREDQIVPVDYDAVDPNPSVPDPVELSAYRLEPEQSAEPDAHQDSEDLRGIESVDELPSGDPVADAGEIQSDDVNQGAEDQQGWETPDPQADGLGELEPSAEAHEVETPVDAHDVDAREVETPMDAHDVEAHDVDAHPVASEPSQPETDPQAGTDQRVESLSAKIEALEAAIGQTPDQWEPDGVVGDDYAGTPVQTIEWQDHDGANADAKPAPHVTPPSQSDKESLDLLVSDEAILDEETLRELVTDLVREELQGALGERITRNVRKLVRREIHRALAAQDLS